MTTVRRKGCPARPTLSLRGLCAIFLVGCAGVASGYSMRDAHEATPAKPARNIVLFIADDHGQDTGAYGNPVVQTPHLDAFAAEGMLFTHAFATTASCSASRSVLLTGLHNHRNGQYGHVHDFHHFMAFDDIRSLPVLLEEAGYRTARAGKYHVAPEAVFHFRETIPGNTRDVVTMVDHARPFLEAESDKPFFLYIATGDPHRGGGATSDDPQGPDARYGVRSVEEYIHRPEFELYDMQADPWESKNLAYLPEYAEALAAYREMLWDFEVRTSDPWLLKQEYE